MKKKLSEFFNVPFNGKKKRTGIVLTIVALVEVILLMVVSTSAWVESINSLKIYNLVPGVVESPINQKVNLDSTKSNIYNLDKYFRASGAYHLTGASSADGNTMYFPEIGSTNNYRVGGINDKNVNYISFTIRTQTAVDLAFDQDPSISFGGTALSGDYRKLVRFSIGDNSGNFKVFSLYPEKFFDENVVIDENGTKGSSAVYPFSDCVKGKDKAVTTTANGLLTFSMWIEDPAPTDTTRAVYDNKALAVSNLKLVIVKPFTVKAASSTGTNGAYQLNNTGGNVAIENSAYGAEATFYAVPGQSVALHALASESNGFSLLGWQTTNPTDSTSASVISGSNTDPYNYLIPSNGNTTVIYALFSNVHNIYMKPEYQFKGSNDNNVRFAAFVFGIDASGVTTGTWYDMTGPVTWKNDGGYYRCTYRGNATSIIFCYMNKNVATNDFDDSHRWLQTYDLQVPSTPGEYGYHITARQVLNKTRNQTGLSEDSDYGTNKLVGFWLHNHVKVNVAYTNTSASGVSENIYPSLTDTSDVSGKAEWYDDAHKNKFLYVDGKAYQDLDSDGYIIPQYKYEKKVTLTAELASNSIYQFDGWYSSASGTGATNRLTTNMTYEITAPNNNAYTGTDTEKQVTYYAKYSRKPSTIVNIYVTPRYNWSRHDLHIWGSNGTVYADHAEATYDVETGYYKYSFECFDSTTIKAKLSSDTSYTNATADLTIATVSPGSSEVKKRINRDAGVSNLGNYHCYWFIDNTSGNWLAADWNKDYNSGQTYMRMGTSTTISSDSAMLRQDNGAWIMERSSAFSSSSYVYMFEVYSNNDTYDANAWRVKFASGEHQYKATGGSGHNGGSGNNWSSGSTG